MPQYKYIPINFFNLEQEFELFPLPKKEITDTDIINELLSYDRFVFSYGQDYTDTEILKLCPFIITDEHTAGYYTLKYPLLDVYKAIKLLKRLEEAKAEGNPMFNRDINSYHIIKDTFGFPILTTFGYNSKVETLSYHTNLHEINPEITDMLEGYQKQIQAPPGEFLQYISKVRNIELRGKGDIAFILNDKDLDLILNRILSATDSSYRINKSASKYNYHVYREIKEGNKTISVNLSEVCPYNFILDLLEARLHANKDSTPLLENFLTTTKSINFYSPALRGNI